MKPFLSILIAMIFSQSLFAYTQGELESLSKNTLIQIILNLQDDSGASDDFGDNKPNEVKEALSKIKKAQFIGQEYNIEKLKSLFSDNIIKSLRKADLLADENDNSSIGYSMCVDAGGSPGGYSNSCKQNGSVGYGLCVVAGGSPGGYSNSCKVDGTVAYGLCVAAGGSPGGYSNSCKSTGTFGYGFCVAAGGSPDGYSNSCKIAGTFGYGICVVAGGSPGGYSNSCKENGSLGYGICVANGGSPGGYSNSCKP